MNLDNTYEAYYVSKEIFETLKTDNKKYISNYTCYLKIHIIRYISNDILLVKMLSKSYGSEFRFFNESMSGSNVILNDYNDNQCNLFTFDGFNFYEAKDLKLNSNKEYEFTLAYNGSTNKSNNSKKEIYNVHLGKKKDDNLFKIDKEDILILSKAFNENIDSVWIAGHKIQVSKISLIKIFLIQDLEGINEQQRLSERLIDGAKAFWGTEIWSFEKHLKYGEDVTTQFINSRAISSHKSPKVNHSLEFDIEQEFEFINYLQQYRNEGIEFSVFEKKENNEAEYINVHQSDGTSVVFAPTVIIDTDGNQKIVSYSIKNGINISLLNAFYKKHLESECQKHEGLIEQDFIEDQIGFLENIDRRIKEEYKYIFRPLLNFFKDVWRNGKINEGKPIVLIQKINFNTSNQLKAFIIDLINNVLEHYILLKEGYMNFWRDQRYSDPKNEIEIQQYIANFLEPSCKELGIHLSRESKEGNGNVDILFSYTNLNNESLKVCLELKKADHINIEKAINTQLVTYMKSAQTTSGIFLVIWLKNDTYEYPKKFESEVELLTAIEKNNTDKENIAVKIINCTKPISPSKK